MTKLEGLTVAAADLVPDQTAVMFQLMQAYYENVTWEQFVCDLRAKDWVILLHENGCIRGFSTQALFDHEMAGRRFKVMFSGDTIIDKTSWGSQALPITWGRLMLSIRVAHPDRDLYWLLISKGYKTYRFLPVFFHEYYPSCVRETPAFERALLNSLASTRFGDRFNAATGTLRAAHDAQRLREGIAEIDERRLRDPHVEFFHRNNPGHAHGDDLVCITRFDRDNLTPYYWRQLQP